MRGKQKPFKLKGIKRVTKRLADGSVKVYLYHRPTGEPLDPNDLVQSYAAAEKKVMVRGRHTLLALIRRFDTSTYFDGLSETTRREYHWKLKRVEARWGSCPIDTFNDPDDALEFRRDALAWHDELGKTSRRSADNLMATLARVLSFAKENSEIKHNPLDTFRRLYKNDRSEMVWSDELQQRFIETARPAMVTALYLVRNTGQRAADIRQFPWVKYDGERIEVRQSKTGKLLKIPATRELKAHLNGLPRRGSLVMLTPTGKAFTKRYFNECWRADADKIGAGELNFHDLRGTAATRLAEAGGTAMEIASVLGWSIERAQRIIATYIARSGVLAANAIAKLEQHRDKRHNETPDQNVRSIKNGN
ncbi:tyrosine-type recombinase/integrase [Bradyrhizobium sp. HKCCYLS3077]|uniref:tyrosine-type recombinase/integrase n=1 Tax=Bradyrhizobium sp. HKCCYLS3077 TaxID=3420761 RepID=UPI003EBFE3D2